MLQIPYSGKFSLVHNFTEMDPDSFEEIFILWNEYVMLWPHPYQLMATLHIQTEEMTLNDKASLCTNDLVFFMYGGLCNYDSIKTAAVDEKLD